jgi:hypothetical protein
MALGAFRPSNAPTGRPCASPERARSAARLAAFGQAGGCRAASSCSTSFNFNANSSILRMACRLVKPCVFNLPRSFHLRSGWHSARRPDPSPQWLCRCTRPTSRAINVRSAAKGTALPRRSGSSRPAGAGLKRAVAWRARPALGRSHARSQPAGRPKGMGGRLRPSPFGPREGFGEP